MLRNSYRKEQFQIKKSVVRNPIFKQNIVQRKKKAQIFEQSSIFQNSVSKNTDSLKFQTSADIYIPQRGQEMFSLKSSCYNASKKKDKLVAPNKHLAQNKIKRLDFFHCDGLIIRSKATKENCLKSEDLKSNEKILTDKKFNEKKQERQENSELLRKKRKSIFSSLISKSVALEKLRQSRKSHQNKQYDALPQYLKNQGYHITFQKEAIVACCL